MLNTPSPERTFASNVHLIYRTGDLDRERPQPVARFGGDRDHTARLLGFTRDGQYAVYSRVEGYIDMRSRGTNHPLDFVELSLGRTIAAAT